MKRGRSRNGNKYINILKLTIIILGLFFSTTYLIFVLLIREGGGIPSASHFSLKVNLEPHSHTLNLTEMFSTNGSI